MVDAMASEEDEGSIGRFSSLGLRLGNMSSLSGSSGLGASDDMEGEEAMMFLLGLP